MRDVLEEIITHPGGGDSAALAAIQRYTKLFWLNVGPYNNLTARKFVLKCTPAAFAAAARAAAAAGARFPLGRGETLDGLLARLEPIFFDPQVDPIVTSKTPGEGQGHPHGEREQPLRRRDDDRSRGLRRAISAQLAARQERQWHARRGGLPHRRPLRPGDSRHCRSSARLPFRSRRRRWRRRSARSITFYTTGETADRLAYDIAWVQDKDSPVDTINGFIEVYMDPRGMKGGWEALVFYVNREKTAGIRTPRRRRAVVRGPHAVGAASTASRASGASPPTPSTSSSRPASRRRSRRSASTCRTIRTCASSTAASRCRWPTSTRPTTSRPRPSSGASSRGRPRRRRAPRSGARWRGELTTDMHEVIGHGSGTHLADDCTAVRRRCSRSSTRHSRRRAPIWSRSTSSPTRRLAELGLLGAADQDEIVQAEYEGYARNALVQLRRIREGTQIEEDHMRNRQMIVRWLMAHSNAIEVRQRDGKTYYVMVDAPAFQGGGRPAARRSAAHQVGRGLHRRGGPRSRPTASTSIRRCATKSSPASSA